MMIRKADFFKSIRTNLFTKGLDQDQVNGLEAILDYYTKKYSDLESLAYVLATAYHETAKTIKPIKEYGLGKGYDYGKKLDMGKGPGHRIPYEVPDQLYYGRGLVQLTWKSNYAAAGKKLNIDLVNFPDKVLLLPVSVEILIEGMVGGWFTGKKLADYFAGPKADAVNARKIINGLDKAQNIAAYYSNFLLALLHATN